MKLKSILLSSILLNSLVGATYDQTTSPQIQSDIPKLCGALTFISNIFDASNYPFGTCPTPTPSPTSTPSNTSSVTNYIAPIITKIKLQISSLGVQEANINQKNGSNTDEQIFENSEILSDGKKADTQIKLTDKEFNLNISIIEGDKNSDETNLKAPSDIEVTMDNNGNTTLKVDEGVEVTAKRDGKIEVKHKDLNIKVKSNGANIEISEDKTITITKENTTVDNQTSIATIEIKANGEIKASITNSNGIKYDFNFPTDSNTKGATIENGALVGEYKALSKFFMIKDNSYQRGLIQGEESVEIIPLNNEAQFEEKLYFEQNYRGIILREGEAEIIVDGVPINMESDKEYILIIQTVESDKLNLNKIYNKDKNYLHLKKGWSLISTPINSELNVTDTFYTKDLAYKFQNNSWIKNPEILKQNEGMWVKYNFNIDVHLNEYNISQNYELNSTILNSGWNLIGAGNDFTLSEDYKIIWAFDNLDKIWVENPNQILRGYGFWIKK